MLRLKSIVGDRVEIKRVDKTRVDRLRTWQVHSHGTFVFTINPLVAKALTTDDAGITRRAKR